MREVIWTEDCQSIWAEAAQHGLSMSQRLTGRNENVLQNLRSPQEVHCASDCL